METCFEEYNSWRWLPFLTFIYMFDITYFLRHINVGLQVFLCSRPLYNMVMKLVTGYFSGYLREHGIHEDDIFESRVYPHEVDLKGRVTDQAAALIMELARNRQLYSTWVILCCWNLDTTLWVVSEARYAWRRRPILFETYRVKTSFAWNKYDNSDDKTDTDVIMLDKRSLKTRFVPLEQVIESSNGEVMCKAKITLALSRNVTLADLLKYYSDRFSKG